MVFSFDSSCISVFGKDFKSQRTPKEKTYSFYMVQGDVAAVNSSATGGKTLMWRVPPKGANA